VVKAVPATIWAHYDTFIFDADGVLWIGSKPLEKAPLFLNQLVDAGKTVLILSNNSSSTPAQYLDKCKRLSFTSLKEENIVSAGIVAAHELKKLQLGETLDPKERSGLSESIPPNLPVYLVGTAGLQQTLKEYAGVDSFGVGPDNFEDYSNETFLMDIDVSRKVSAVIGSFDPHISYIKIMKAINYLKDPNVHFIVTNEDITFPGNVPGVIVPGAGCVTTVLRAVSGREPIVMGKPHSASFNYIRERFHIDPKKTLMVGDRCDTDIWFGNRHGLDTLLVLSGVHQLENVKQYEAASKFELIPKFYLDRVGDLAKE